MISFVIPCYCSSKTIGGVVKRIEEVIGQIDDKSYEIILVNDHSKDNTWEIIRDMSEMNPHIISIDLAKNCGQHCAMMAGLNNTCGDYIVTLDDDGQTPIEGLPEMLRVMEEKAYDVVSPRYIKRDQPSLFRRFGSKVHKLTTRIMLDKPGDVCISAFLLMKRFVVDEIVKYEAPYPYVPGLAWKVTNNIGNIEMIQGARAEGQSGYSFKKLVSLWMNGFTSFSVKPLRAASTAGAVMSVAGFIVLIIAVIKEIINHDYNMMLLLIIAIQLVTCGIILLMLGLVGEYVGRTYMSMSRTPQYVIREIHKQEKQHKENQGN